jgi:hypothetical protein
VQSQFRNFWVFAILGFFFDASVINSSQGCFFVAEPQKAEICRIRHVEIRTSRKNYGLGKKHGLPVPCWVDEMTHPVKKITDSSNS